MDPQHDSARPLPVRPHSISCVKCGLSNFETHRFCRQCGSALWTKCVACGSERPIDESYCASCGADIQSAEREFVAAQQKRLAEARQQAERRDLNAAIQTLQYLARQNHPRLAEIRLEAERLLPEVTALRDQLLQRAGVYTGRARILLEESRFGEVVDLLSEIPDSLRDQELQQLLAQARSAVVEIDALKQVLVRRDGGTLAERLAAIDRLLELDPQNPRFRQWSDQIHHHLLNTANAKLQEYRFDDAHRLLLSLPARLHSDQSGKLLRHAEELAHLAFVLQSAPTVDAASLEAARRLARLAPNSAHIQQQYQEMAARFQAAQSSSPAVDWAACPEKTFVGPPVHHYPLARRLRASTPQIAAALRQHPGEFHVACGLALQALGKSALSINLLPPEKRGVIGLLATSLRERPVTASWGIDLGSSSLKAVRLAVNDQQVEITHCFHHRHRLNQSHPDAAGQAQSLLRESLQAFADTHSVESAERVATQWPTIHALTRLLTIPCLEGKKLRELIQREAQHQIPSSLSEVCWDHTTFPNADPRQRTVNQHLLLVATRRLDLETRRDLFRECGIDLHVMQCDAAALHNLLHFEIHQDPAAPVTAPPAGAAQDAAEYQLARGGIAAWDIGAAATGILYSFPDFAWFRAVRPADDDLISALAHRFKLTRDVAEQVKCDPTRVKRMSELHGEASVIYRKLVGQFSTVADEVHKISPHRPIRQLLLTGGGARTHGLLQFLRYGR